MAVAESRIEFKRPDPMNERYKGKEKIGKEEDSPSKENPRKPSQGRWRRWEDKEQLNGGPKEKVTAGCFLYDRPHQVRDCSKQNKLTTFILREESEEETREPTPLRTLRLGAITVQARKPQNKGKVSQAPLPQGHRSNKDDAGTSRGEGSKLKAHNPYRKKARRRRGSRGGKKEGNRTIASTNGEESSE